ncbi:MAG TPA: radical SAM protein [Syntrophomonadaceae bacterium]|nr:radical SAM protein [Syntrophomonadaceae bacterium]
MIKFTTKSLCPECLKTIPAYSEEQNGKVFLKKECPEHGEHRTMIWSNATLYDTWAEESEHATVTGSDNAGNGNCPYECGLCREHEGETCIAIFHLLDDCNLRCPVCFADSSGNQTQNRVSLANIRRMYTACLAKKAVPSIQLSGGEVTLRDDLPAIIRMGKEMGLSHIQVNTNGLRLAQEKDYALSLKEAGTDLIYLQFDGVSDDVYRYLRGRDLLQVKLEALQNCRKAGIGVLLVPTVYRGINDDQLGEIISLAKQWMPTVKGIHFQPVSFFGRSPEQDPNDEQRITIPDVLEMLEEQTAGEIMMNAIIPRRKFDAHCSFSSVFMLGWDGRLHPITRHDQTTSLKITHPGLDQFAVEAIAFTNKFWRVGRDSSCCYDTPQVSRITEWLCNYTLSISGMHFQDVWNIDLNRLKGCCVHVATPAGKFVPLCAYYLTSTTGQRLYETEVI